MNFCQIRGDIIETYKILSGKYDASMIHNVTSVHWRAKVGRHTDITNNACTFRTRGNDMRLQKVQFKYDLRKYYFTNRVVNIC